MTYCGARHKDEMLREESSDQREIVWHRGARKAADWRVLRNQGRGLT